jgi:hypothetical protein
LRRNKAVERVRLAEPERLDPPAGLPLSAAAAQIGLQPRRAPIAIVDRLGQKAQHDPRQHLGHRRDLRRRRRQLRQVAVDPLERVGGLERQPPGQHLIEDHAQRIQIGALIERAVHAPGLLRRHMRKRPFDQRRTANQRRSARGRPLARRARGQAQLGQLDLPLAVLDENAERSQLAMDHAPAVNLAERGSDGDGELEKAPGLHRRAEQRCEHAPARVFEHQRGHGVKLLERDWPHDRGRIERAGDPIFVLEPGQRLGIGRLRPEDLQQDRPPIGAPAGTVDDRAVRLGGDLADLVGVLGWHCIPGR